MPGTTLEAVTVPQPLFDLTIADLDRPLLAVALHHGGDVRPEVAALLALDEAERRREEDPYSGLWSAISPNRIIAHRSRFEVDLNRPLGDAVYLRPGDYWGLDVWRAEPPPELIARSRAEHARFYRTAFEVISILLTRSARVLVLDLHSYNHRRDGASCDASANPELNVGTGTMLERDRWAPVIDAFIAGARASRSDREVDVRENVRFFGGYFPAWVHRTFPERACALALEVKKTFMDERSGRVDVPHLIAWREILRAGTQRALRVLEAG